MGWRFSIVNCRLGEFVVAFYRFMIDKEVVWKPSPFPQSSRL